MHIIAMLPLYLSMWVDATLIVICVEFAINIFLILPTLQLIFAFH